MKPWQIVALSLVVGLGSAVLGATITAYTMISHTQAAEDAKVKAASQKALDDLLVKYGNPSLPNNGRVP